MIVRNFVTTKGVATFFNKLTSESGLLTKRSCLAQPMEAGVLNERSCLAAALGGTKILATIVMN
jgi:hypothetical protein